MKGIFVTTGKLITGALLGGVAYWFFDAATDAFIFQEGTFRARAFFPPPSEIYMRSISIALLAALGFAAVLLSRHKQDEDVLRQKDELLRMTSERAKVGGWEFDVATLKGTWTDEVARIHELPPEQETNVEFAMNFYTPESRIMIEKGIQDAIGSAKPYDLELELVTARGAHKWVRTVGFPEMEGDNVVKVKGTLQDITDRKLAEQALRASDMRFRALFDSMLNGFAYCRMLFENGAPVDFVYLEVNGAFERLTGLKNVIGRKVTEVIPGIREANPELFEMYGRTVSTGEPVQIEQYVAPLNMWFSISVYRPQEGHFVAVFDVITERKKSEQSLRETTARMGAVMDSINALIYVADLKTHELLFVNKYGRDIWGEIAGKTCWKTLQEGQSGPCAFCTNDRLVKQDGTPGEVYAWEFQNTVNNHWYDCRDQAIRWDDGRLVRMEIATDITERKKLEAQLRHAQKMEGIGTLAGGIAHDFNNILSAIIGYGNIASMKLPEDHQVRHDLEQILEAAERATVLTQSLLTFSRKQPVKVELLELNTVIGRFEKFLLRLLREDIELKTNYSNESLTFMADRGQIEQVVMNLVTNARDAMPAHGTLTIETKPTTLDGSFAAAHGYGKAGEYAMISVSDTGAGMNEETKRRIFEPFFTTKEVGKGTGLGLAMVYGIVKTNDGFINVYSEPGRGTAFHIYLPLVRSAAREVEPVKTASALLKGGTETILLAEDDASLRKMTTVVLRHMGYTVIEVENGKEAVEKFIEHMDAIRLVILDGIMPVMNGKEAYHEIIALAPDLRVIFMSGYAEDVFTKDGVLLDAVEFLAKPVTPTVLLQKVREVLDR